MKNQKNHLTTLEGRQNLPTPPLPHRIRINIHIFILIPKKNFPIKIISKILKNFQ